MVKYVFVRYIRLFIELILGFGFLVDRHNGKVFNIFFSPDQLCDIKNHTFRNKEN